MISEMQHFAMTRGSQKKNKIKSRSKHLCRVPFNVSKESKHSAPKTRIANSVET